MDKALTSSFKHVLSVEVVPAFHEQAKERFQGDSRVQLFLGASTHKLPEMLKSAALINNGPGSGPCVCFLDAHPCGPGTGGHDDLMKHGEKSLFHQDNILQAEIQLLLSDEGKHQHVLLIDDQYNDQFAPFIQKFRSEYTYFYCSDADGGNSTKVFGCMPTAVFKTMMMAV